MMSVVYIHWIVPNAHSCTCQHAS